MTAQALPVTPAALLRLSGQIAFLAGSDMKTEEQRWPTAPVLRRWTQDLTVKDARRQEQGDGRPRVGECPLLTHPRPGGRRKGQGASGGHLVALCLILRICKDSGPGCQERRCRLPQGSAPGPWQRARRRGLRN